MTIERFNEVVNSQIAACSGTLISKGEEYAPETLGVKVKDRLGHFKKAAAIMDTTPKAALLGMLSKHIVSVSDMCTDRRDYPAEKWDEKITDSINYLLILRALVAEEQEARNGQD